jgi:hypothetical protein
MKKVQSQAEIDWRKARHDERWEIRADHLMWVFSKPMCALPRQIAHQKANPPAISAQSGALAPS